MSAVIWALLLISGWVPQQPKVVEIKKCFRIATQKPDATGLNCGLDQNGEDILIDIPETIYQFPKGEVFALYIYSNGHQEFPVNKQPKGSVVRKTPPCQPGPFTSVEGRRPANSGPCDPELK